MRMHNFKKQTSPQGASAAAFLPHTGWKPKWEQICSGIHRDEKAWLVDRKTDNLRLSLERLSFNKPWPFSPCRDWHNHGWRTHTYFLWQHLCWHLQGGACKVPQPGENTAVLAGVELCSQTMQFPPNHFQYIISVRTENCWESAERWVQAFHEHGNCTLK